MFVLREVFDMPYDEIAEAVGRTPTAVRQIAHRAREHVAARRPRMQVTGAEQGEVVERFLAAVRSGDVQGLLEVLAPDVVVVVGRRRRRGRCAAPDRGRRQGGGTSSPAWRARSRTSRRGRCGSTARRRCGSTSTAALDTVAGLVVEDGRISRIYAIRNPHKLARLDQEATLTR